MTASAVAPTAPCRARAAGCRRGRLHLARTCGRCDAPLADGVAYCPRCGTATGGSGLRRWSIAVVATLVAGSGAGLWFAYDRSDPAGAASPEEAVREFTEAVNGDDPLLIVRAVAPSDVEATEALIERIAAGLDRLGVDGWQPDGAGTLDIDVDLDEVAVVDQQADTARVTVTGDVHVEGIDVQGPLGLVVPDEIDVSLESLDDRFGGDAGDGIVAVVREGGRWFVSPVDTAASLVDVPSVLDAAIERATGALADVLDADSGSDG